MIILVSYRKTYKSKTEKIPSSLLRSSALLGPTPFRYAMGESRFIDIAVIAPSAAKAIYLSKAQLYEHQNRIFK